MLFRHFAIRYDADMLLSMVLLTALRAATCLSAMLFY